MWRLTAVLLAILSVGGCDIPPSHSALYPPDEDQLRWKYNITHDRYHPWAFNPVDPHTGGR